MKRFRRILVATNFSPSSARAVREALALARADGAELLVAHAYRPPDRIPADCVGPGVYEEWDRNLRAAVNRRLAPIVEAARHQLVVARALALPGNPRKAIASAARRYKVDVIVAGTSERRRWWRFVFHNKAARLFVGAPCPVLAVCEEPGEATARDSQGRVLRFPAAAAFRTGPAVPVEPAR